MPKADARGEYRAVEYARALLARKIIKARRLAGLSQAALARRASIRPACHGEAQRSRETLNRIERGRTTPDTATIAKTHRALETAQDEEQPTVLAKAATSSPRSSRAAPPTWRCRIISEGRR